MGFDWSKSNVHMAEHCVWVGEKRYALNKYDILWQIKLGFVSSNEDLSVRVGEIQRSFNENFKIQLIEIWFDQLNLFYAMKKRSLKTSKWGDFLISSHLRLMAKKRKTLLFLAWEREKADEDKERKSLKRSSKVKIPSKLILMCSLC